jgi:hypothetical protein
VTGNYCTCEKGHKIYVVWVEEKNQYAFTCDECKFMSPVVETIKGVVELKVHEGARLKKTQ